MTRLHIGVLGMRKGKIARARAHRQARHAAKLWRCTFLPTINSPAPYTTVFVSRPTVYLVHFLNKRATTSKEMGYRLP